MIRFKTLFNRSYRPIFVYPTITLTCLFVGGLIILLADTSACRTLAFSWSVAIFIQTTLAMTQLRQRDGWRTFTGAVLFATIPLSFGLFGVIPIVIAAIIGALYAYSVELLEIIVSLLSH